MKVLHIILGLVISIFATYGKELAPASSPDNVNNKKNNTTLISDEAFSNLETFSESIAVIITLMYGENCQRNLEKALAYSLECLEYFEEDEIDYEDGSVNPHKYAFHVLAARCYLGLSNIEEAQKMLNKEKNKGSIILTIEGDIAMRLGDMAEAQKKYEEALARDSDNLEACMRMYTFAQLGLVPSYYKDMQLIPDAPYDRKLENLSASQWLMCLKSNNRRWVNEVESFEQQDEEWIFEEYADALDAAYAGIPAAMHYLAKVYKTGCGFIKKDADRAEYWLEQATLFSENTDRELLKGRYDFILKVSK